MDIMIKFPAMTKFILLLASMSFSTMFASTTLAAAAGKVVFSTGSAKAVNASGASRALRRGDEVFSGDSLQTSARSRIQVAFADGAYISVQPSSEYKIENYNYSGKADGSERAFYRLLKGGIRAVTGYIGKRNRDAYKVSTAVATIGIRGTGHNTRICAGDCPGKKDGLYHNTWEGETSVENDKDSKNVPAGNGVYVEKKDSKIKSTSQPDGATALDTAREEKEKQEEDEEQGGLVSSGNQRTADEGLQTIVVEDDEVKSPFGNPTFSEVIGGLSLQGVGPDLDDIESVEASDFSDVSIFKNSNGKPIAFFGTEEDDDSGTVEIFEVFATIDPEAALGADDSTVASDVKKYLDEADTNLVNLFLENPAEVAEFATTPEGLAVGRWANGRVLSVDRNLGSGTFGATDVEELSGFQSIHFIYGEAAGPIPTVGSATYQLTTYTHSTSVSGDTIGDGAVPGGSISVFFSSANASINFDVDHGSTMYSIGGNLMIDGVRLQDTTVIASTGTPGSACNPSCNTFIDGLFLGPGAPSMPNNIGIEYDIQDTDVITSVAGFSYEITPP